MTSSVFFVAAAAWDGLASRRPPSHRRQSARYRLVTSRLSSVLPDAKLTGTCGVLHHVEEAHFGTGTYLRVQNQRHRAGASRGVRSAPTTKDTGAVAQASASRASRGQWRVVHNDSSPWYPLKTAEEIPAEAAEDLQITDPRLGVPIPKHHDDPRLCRRDAASPTTKTRRSGRASSTWTTPRSGRHYNKPEDSERQHLREIKRKLDPDLAPFFPLASLRSGRPSTGFAIVPPSPFPPPFFDKACY